MSVKIAAARRNINMEDWIKEAVAKQLEREASESLKAQN